MREKGWILFVSVLAILLGIKTNSSFICLLVIIFQLVQVLLYRKYKLFDFLMKFEVVLVTALVLLDFPWMADKPSRIELILFYLFFIGACWLLKSFTRSIEVQERRSYEQERSLDDMLKVVSAKCEEARGATKSKSMFLSNMSHEIRTPLNAILGMNEMILRDSEDPQIFEYASNIESSGRMLLSLINDILDFSKIEAGKMELVNVEYQVGSVFNDLVNMLKPRAEEKKLQFEIEINSKMPNLLYGDEVRIKQIATNLLTNAVKYTEEGSVKLIADFTMLSEKEMELYIGVEDTGSGITEEDQQKLFQSFQRVSQEANRYVEGTGLGLTITQRFVEMMGGIIQVKSEYGKGSLFSTRIKQKVVSTEPIGDFQTQFRQSVAERQKEGELFTAPLANILVVDDNAMNLQVVKGLLKPTRIRIDTADSGAECLACLQKKQYDLILLDHMMPGMDGIETLHRMKQEHLAENIPVIALTANAVSGARERYFAEGFNDYLSKPISAMRLEKMVKTWLPESLIVSVQEKKAAGFAEPSEEQKETVLPECINQAQALEYSADGMDGVFFNIEIFAEEAGNMKQRLVDAYAAEDTKQYGIQAHALKSTSATIGLTELSEFAKKLEQAGKENDMDFIRVNHEKLIEQFDAVREKLKNIKSE